MSSAQHTVSTDIVFSVKQISLDVLSKPASKHFIKHMLPLCVTNILYNRLQLNKDNFETRTVGALKLVNWKPNVNNHILQIFNTWIKGARDAIDEEHLREFILLVKDNSNNNSIKEYYKFTLKYQPEQRMKNKISAKELMRSTCDLFKVIEQLGCYERAEECITLEVALTFYQRETPLGYELPGFHKENYATLLSLIDAGKPRFGNNQISGNLTTNFHDVSYNFALDVPVVPVETASYTTEKTDDNVIEIISDGESSCGTKGTKRSLELDDESLDSAAAIKDNNKEGKKSKVDLSGDQRSKQLAFPENNLHSSPWSSQKDFECTCHTGTFMTVLKIIVCSHCKRAYHSACQGVLELIYAPQPFVCNRCHAQETGIPFSDGKERTTALYRLLIAYSYLTRKMPNVILAMLDENMKQHILSKLQENGMLFLDEDNMFQINYKHIKEVLVPKYLKYYGTSQGLVPQNLLESPVNKINSK